MCTGMNVCVYVDIILRSDVQVCWCNIYRASAIGIRPAREQQQQIPYAYLYRALQSKYGIGDEQELGLTACGRKM